MNTKRSGGDDLAERLEAVFPKYLSDPSRENLRRSLLDHPDYANFYASGWEGPDQPLQGDGWNGLTWISFSVREGIQVTGIVLSNSCDIEIENRSILPKNVLFAPLIPLDSLIDRLQDGGISEEKVSSTVDSIRKQEITQIFYLPKSHRIPECVCFLDDVSAVPLKFFWDARQELLFRLSNYGFYIFLMKLSIHFTRFGEAIDRAEAPPVTR